MDKCGKIDTFKFYVLVAMDQMEEWKKRSQYILLTRFYTRLQILRLQYNTAAHLAE